MCRFIHSTAGKGSFWKDRGNVGERFLEICFFSPWIWSSEQKESLLKSAAQTRCVKWELPGCDFSGKHPLAIVSQSTSAGPSTLTPIHERSRVTKVLWRKKGSMWDGTTRSTKYSFPLRVRCPSGVSDGVSDTGHPPFVLNGICCLFQGLVSTIRQYSAP